MLSKLNNFLNEPLTRQLFLLKSFVRHRPVFIIEKMLVMIVKVLTNTNFGRRLLFLAHRKNELLLAKTEQGTLFLVNTSDLVIGKSVYEKKIAFDSTHLIKAINILGLSQQSTLFDVGANIGTVGCHAVKQGLVKRCIAFEPDPTNFEILNRNIQLNNLSESVIAFNVALSDQNKGLLEFEQSKTNFGDHKVRNLTKVQSTDLDRNVIRVPAQTLDFYIEYLDEPNSVVFMDTQGFEANILAGARKFLSKGVPFVISFCPYSLMRYNAFEILLDALEEAPYSHLVDLKEPTNAIKFERAAFINIHSQLGLGGNNTDLLIFAK